MKPLVSVITPTWQRHDLLLGRCMPSVKAQTYPNVEHVIVSDGPDEQLDKLLWEQVRERKRTDPRLTWGFLDEHDPVRHWGIPGRLQGLNYAQGDLIAYLDDDDEYTERHIEVLAEVLEDNPQVMWAYSQMISFGQADETKVIGDGVPSPCNIGAGRLAAGGSVGSGGRPVPFRPQGHSPDLA
jgi:GT2 family glycosyltransferase